MSKPTSFIKTLSSFTADNIGEMLQKLEACLFLLEFKLNTPGQ